MPTFNKNENTSCRTTAKTLRMVPRDGAPQVKDIFADQPSEQAQKMRKEILRVARRSYNILITGETGTGKTLMARQIHRMSERAGSPFIELNCANLPEHLVEAELFGYRKGAFTGADHDRKGLFEEAEGGILFLDEIGDIAPTVQNRLLKAIDEKQIKRLGTNHYQVCDVQIIAATSRNLPKMIAEREFREDLYCRLAVLTVEACPLRNRREDMPAMVAHFLQEAANATGKRDYKNQAYSIADDALALVCEFDYPGNIRSLRNFIVELTSHVEEKEPICAELVQIAFERLRKRGSCHAATSDRDKSVRSLELDMRTAAPIGNGSHSLEPQVLLHSIAREGDIILPLDLCVLRRGETFKEWTTRAKRSSIEAVRQATGGTLQTVADRLGLTTDSLKSHLRRAKCVQKETLFD